VAKPSASKKARPQLALFDPETQADPKAALPAPPPGRPPADAPSDPAPPKEPQRAVAPPRRATAEAMATKQREISVSEFFVKNRHLLGFDNPSKAILTTIKEAVDNSFDACEEAGILPELTIEVHDLALEAA
jgi:DNA topoisomerase-6 subunit B